MKIVLEQEDLKHLPVSVNPNILGGRPVFTETRVPVDALWNNLADGATLEEFLDGFPTVTRQQAEEVLLYGYRAMSAAS